MEPDWTAEEQIPIRDMLTPADFLSLTNGWLGVLAIISIASGATTLAFSLILVAAVFDGLDGLVARMGYGGGRLGSTLDSYADLVSFVVAPAFLFWKTYAGGSDLFGRFPTAAIVLVVALLYFATGLLRLARFDYLSGGERHDYFLGLATPGAAAVLTSVALVPWDSVPAIAGAALLSLLMVSRVRLPKLRGSLSHAAGLVLLLAALAGDRGPSFGPILILAFFFAYLVFGPGYVRRHTEADDEPQFTY